MVAIVPYVLAVTKDMPVNSPQEFIALAKSKPEGLNYSSAGNGSGNHLTAELFMKGAGIKAQHIPYKSGGEMVTALMTNQVSFTLAALPSALSYIKSGGVKVLAVTTLQPSPALPGIPTLASTALPGFNVTEWLGIFVPAGTPPDVVARLNAATNKALQSAELKAKLSMLGADASGGPPEALDKIFRGDMSRWAALAKEIKFELQ
jgi:tripartite-type tricarboxylate transporter receptor subunit TctC